MSSDLDPESSSSSNSVALTPLETALKDSLLPPDFRDVHLYAFSRRTTISDGSTKIDHPLPVVAIASFLKQTDYFSKLLTSGFAESNDGRPTAAGPSINIRQQVLDSEYDYESDSDLDEYDAVDDVPEKAKVPSGALYSTQDDVTDKPKGAMIARRQPAHRQILLPSIAYRTLRACIFYIYTGKLNFLPLRSSGNRQSALLTQSAPAVPPCSPKSMYRLAESCGMTALQDLAYQTITARLTASNIVKEAFSSFYWRYDRLREHAVSVISQHYQDAGVQAALKETVERVAHGELLHAGALLISLLHRRTRFLWNPVGFGCHCEPDVKPGGFSWNTTGFHQCGRSPESRWLAWLYPGPNRSPNLARLMRLRLACERSVQRSGAVLLVPAGL